MAKTKRPLNNDDQINLRLPKALKQAAIKKFGGELSNILREYLKKITK